MSKRKMKLAAKIFSAGCEITLAGMTDHEVAAYWNGNADAWTALSRAGHDQYRDALNMPAFLQMLPDVNDRRGLDIGCGEGTNTRALAARGAIMHGVDIAERFIAHARAHQDELSVDFSVASAQRLPFEDGAFDFATAIMSLMDLPDPVAALRETARVVRPGGFLQFSITHPCFNATHRRNCRDADGRMLAVETGVYFDPIDGEIDRWIFSAAPETQRQQYEPFAIPRFNRTLANWLNAVAGSGFRIDRLAEPRPTVAQAEADPRWRAARFAPYFLHVLARR